jgi:serine protease
VMPVAATTQSGARASYSNYGPGVAISAPGGDWSLPMILSTVNSGTQGPVSSPAGDTYALYIGTSMATPHVVGVASLVLSTNPGLSLAQLRKALQSTARAFPAGSNNCTTSSCGAGIVDAYAALKSVAVPAITSLSPPFVEAGGPVFSLTVDGLYFLASAKVYWNGSPRTTTVVNSRRLSASISAAEIAQVGTASITVVNGASGLVSSPAVFDITGPLSTRSYLPVLRR